jgi:hypothetical protein
MTQATELRELASLLKVDSGNVGIGLGTDTPDQPLHIKGTRPIRIERAGVGEFEISIDNTVTGDSLDFVIEPVSGSVSAGFQVRTRQTDGTLLSSLSVNHDGKVGIGTIDPATTLNVESSSYPYVRVTNTGYTGFDIGQADSSEGGAALVKLRDVADMDFYTADLNRMRISSTGNVGIGLITTDPSHKLHVSGDIKSDQYLIDAIAKDISDTALDVFVYDTRKDSDGGAWRKRTQHTSWYNETLNTSTRGARKEFPSVAVIVAETTQLTIYDGDDPDLPMWMVFNSSGVNGAAMLGRSSESTTSVAILNGILSVGRSSFGLHIVHFISDFAEFKEAGYDTPYVLPIGTNRNSGNTWTTVNRGNDLVNDTINDVAMTVLPNAPIDADTGLPVPTIAVATAGGVSVIKDDGNVVDSGYTSNASTVAFCGSDAPYLVYGRSDFGQDRVYESGNFLTGGFSSLQYPNSNIFGSHNNPNVSAYSNDGWAFGTREGSPLTYKSGAGLWLVEKPSTFSSKVNERGDLFSHISYDYNTGWMNGDIKLATLSDTDTTNVTGTNLISGDAASDDTNSLGDFSAQTGGILSINTNASYVKVGSRSIHIIATQGASGGRYYKSNFLTVGKTYTVSGFFNASNGSASNKVQFYLGGTNGASNYGAQDEFCSVANTWYPFSHTFTALTTHLSISFVEQGSGNATDFYVDGLEVRLAEEDRTVNNNGLQVFGNVTKTPVATGADLVGYSGWSASNYLRQPYNSDLIIGTGSYSVMCWVKPTSLSAVQYFLGIGVSDATELLLLGVQTTGYIYFDYGNGAAYTNTNSLPLNANTWQHLCVHVTAGQKGHVYINGVEAGYSVNNVAPNTLMTDTTYELTIGGNQRAGTVNATLPCSLALVRLSATAPSAEQIKKIYNDEKHLFQENAKATLYGSSDLVTAIAYDDDTDLLHVGTSAGRSVFQGLSRVDNTTDAVGTAISASNGLVAED